MPSPNTREQNLTYTDKYAKWQNTLKLNYVDLPTDSNFAICEIRSRNLRNGMKLYVYWEYAERNSAYSQNTQKYFKFEYLRGFKT
jgi:hypothetical protein